MEGIAGLGELGLPELGRMAGGMPDPSFVNQLLQNPAIMQMMQSLLSNAQFMNQLLSLLGSNSQLSSMLQNPELIGRLVSGTLQQLLSFQQSFYPLVFSNKQTSNKIKLVMLQQVQENPMTHCIRDLASQPQTQVLSSGTVCLNKKLHLSSSLAAGVINTSGLEFLMNQSSELGSGAGVPNNPDGYHLYCLNKIL